MCQEKTPGTLKPGMLETARIIKFGIDRGLLLPSPRVSFQDRNLSKSVDLVYEYIEDRERVKVACKLERDITGRLGAAIIGPSDWNNRLIGMGWANFSNKTDAEPRSIYLRFSPATTFIKDGVAKSIARWWLEELDYFGELDFGIKPWEGKHAKGSLFVNVLYQSIQSYSEVWGSEVWKSFLEKTKRELPSEARLAIDWGLGKHSPSVGNEELEHH